MATCPEYYVSHFFELMIRLRKSTENLIKEVIASNGVPYIQMKWVGSHNTTGKEKEGMKELTR